MKTAVCVVASFLCLSACNRAPTVELHNATTQQVAQAVTKAGVMNSDTMVQPGLWRSKTVIQEMDMPGIPQQYLAQMKQSIAEHRNETSSHCIKPEDVKKPKEDFFGANKACKYDHFTMGGGKIDVAMICRQEETTQTMNMSGSYTPTSYSIDTSLVGTGGHENGMTMKMHVDAERVGECTGKED